ncbi:hypothetical protein F5Y14DRAFT_443390 [Nemania sp. NC0429]|nr:hypothetical protein F5Y14DRAFT_443390 [Nemania sp. NC0429]
MSGSSTEWPDGPTPETWGYDDQESLVQQVGKRVENAWGKRNNPSRYQHVIVLLVHWEEHDLGDSIDECVRKYESMFENLYHYEVWRIKLPGRSQHEAMAKNLLELASRDSPESLFIIWYDGHGIEHGDRRGAPTWSSHRDPKKARILDSTIISAMLGDCESDILLVNNACNSLTCSRFNGKGIVESISASAFQTSTYGAIDPSDPSPSMSWAAHKILSDKRCVDEGITVAELHRRICVATQWGVTSNNPNFNGPDCDEAIATRDESTIRTQAVYTRLSADAASPGGRTRSIVLRKLDIFVPTSHPVSRGELQIRIQVEDPDNIDPKQWADWITSAPQGVLSVQLETPREPETAQSIPW